MIRAIAETLGVEFQAPVEATPNSVSEVAQPPITEAALLALLAEALPVVPGGDTRAASLGIIERMNKKDEPNGQ